MRGRALAFAGVVAVGIWVCVSAVAAGPPAGLRVSMETKDGSMMFGALAVTSLPVRTVFGDVDLAAKLICKIELKPDAATAVFLLANGDRLTGEIGRKQLALDTLLGPLAVDLQHVLRISALSAQAPAPLEGLVLHYTFDDDDGASVGDKSASGNNGTANGAATVNDPERGRCFRFRAGGAGIRAPASPSLETLDAFSLCGWVKCRSFRDCSVLFNKFYESHTGQYMMRVSAAGNVMLNVEFSAPEGGSVELQSTQPLPLDRWAHVAATFDRGKTALYIDGELRASNDPGGIVRLGPPGYPHDELRLGARHNGTQPLDGLMDDVRIYSRALTPAEVKALVASTVAPTAPDNDTFQPTRPPQ